MVNCCRYICCGWEKGKPKEGRRPVRCCGCLKSTHEAILFFGMFLVFWGLIISNSSAKTSLGGQAASLSFIIFGFFFSCTGCWGSAYTGSPSSPEPIDESEIELADKGGFAYIRRMAALSAVVQLSTTVCHYYAFYSRWNWFQFKQGSLAEQMNQTDTQLTNYGIAYITCLISVYAQMTLSFCKASRLGFEFTMFFIFWAGFFRLALFVSSVTEPEHCLNDHSSNDYAERVVLLILSAISFLSVAFFEVTMFRQIYNKRRDWESAPFYPNPRADYEKARNIVQNVGRWIFELRSNFQEGNVAGQSKAETEMETFTPLPIPGRFHHDKDMEEQDDSGNDGGQASVTPVQGEENRMNRLQEDMLDHIITCDKLKGKITKLENVDAAGDEFTEIQRAHAIAEKKQQLYEEYLRVKCDEEYLRKQENLKRMHRSIEWSFLPFDVMYMRVHSNLCNILILSGGYLWVSLLYDWANIFGSHRGLLTFGDVYEIISGLGKNVEGGGGTVVAALSALLALAVKMGYITVVTTLFLAFITLGNNEAASSDVMLVSVTILSCTAMIAYAFMAYAATSTDSDHSVESIASWAGTVICLVYAVCRLSLALMSKGAGKPSSYDRKMDKDEAFVRQKLRPTNKNDSLSATSLAYRQNLHDYMGLPAAAPERTRGVTQVPMSEAGLDVPVAANPASAAAVTETTASYLIHPCFDFDVEQDGERTILNFTTKSTCPLTYEREIECYLIPLAKQSSPEELTTVSGAGGGGADGRNEVNTTSTRDARPSSSGGESEDFFDLLGGGRRGGAEPGHGAATCESKTNSNQNKATTNAEDVREDADDRADESTSRKKAAELKAKLAVAKRSAREANVGLLAKISSMLHQCVAGFNHLVHVFKSSPALMAIGIVLSVVTIAAKYSSGLENPLFATGLAEVNTGLVTIGDNIDQVIGHSAEAAGQLNITSNKIDNALENIEEMDATERSLMDTTLQTNFGITVDELEYNLQVASNVTTMALRLVDDVEDYAAQAEEYYDKYFPLYHRFMKSWTRAYKIGSALGGSLLFIFTVVPLYSFETDLKVLRKQAKPAFGRIISDYMQVRNVAKIVGVQFSIAYYGYYFYGFVFSCIVVVFLDPNLRGKLGTVVLQNLGYVIGYAMVLAFQMFFLDGYIFEKKFSTGRMIKEPRFFSIMMLIMSFYGIFTGLFTVVVRFIFGFGYTTMAVCRIDLCVLPINLAKLDKGFRCYLSTLNFFNQYTAPIFITGVSSLRDMQPPKGQGFEGDKKATEEDDRRITGVWASTATANEGKADASKSEGILDDMSSTDLQTKKKRARSRWHLAYTLVRNPVLTRVRGHYLDSLADNTGDDLRTSPYGLEVAEEAEVLPPPTRVVGSFSN